jgi:hypothetical protein
MQDVTSPVSLPSFILCKIFFFSLTLCTASFFTQSAQLIFSIPHHRISKLPGGNVDDFGGDNIGHCEEKEVYMNACLFLNGYRYKAV